MLERLTQRVWDMLADRDIHIRWESAEAIAKGILNELLSPTMEMLLEGQQQVDLSEEVGKFEFISREETADIWRAMLSKAAETQP